MVLQPAAGARDLNPQQVETNHLITQRLAKVYQLWGYEEVSPPRVERLETLMAGGAISSKEIAKLVADEPLGLRPEMTASIARAACSRLAQRPRPLRLWAAGTVFESGEAIEGGLYIEENLISGVELLGVKEISAEMELLSLLLAAMEILELKADHCPTLLLGHTCLMNLILSSIKSTNREYVKTALINYDLLTIEQLDHTEELSFSMLDLISLRGSPNIVLNKLEEIFGQNEAIENLRMIFKIISPLANNYNINLQLDPTFQPHFDLYNGIVFQLICQGHSAPMVIAKGGRYDALLSRFGAEDDVSAGVGFSFSVDQLRELIVDFRSSMECQETTLIAYGATEDLEIALKRQHELHQQGKRAIIELKSCEDPQEASKLMKSRNCTNVEWLTK